MLPMFVACLVLPMFSGYPKFTAVPCREAAREYHSGLMVEKIFARTCSGFRSIVDFAFLGEGIKEMCMYISTD